MRLALLVLLCAAPAAAQPAFFTRAGVGLDVGSQIVKVTGSVSAGIAGGGWAGGAYVEHAEQVLPLFSSPYETASTVALLVGPEVRPTEGRVYVVVWAGPAFVWTVERGDLIDGSGWGEAYEPVERAGLGGVARVAVSAFPFSSVPVGVSVDAGASVSRAGPTASGTLGLVVQLGG